MLAVGRRQLGRNLSLAPLQPLERGRSQAVDGQLFEPRLELADVAAEAGPARLQLGLGRWRHGPWAELQGARTGGDRAAQHECGARDCLPEQRQEHTGQRQEGAGGDRRPGPGRNAGRGYRERLVEHRPLLLGILQVALGGGHVAGPLQHGGGVRLLQLEARQCLGGLLQAGPGFDQPAGQSLGAVEPAEGLAKSLCGDHDLALVRSAQLLEPGLQLGRRGHRADAARAARHQLEPGCQRLRHVGAGGDFDCLMAHQQGALEERLVAAGVSPHHVGDVAERRRDRLPGVVPPGVQRVLVGGQVALDPPALAAGQPVLERQPAFTFALGEQ